MKSDDNLARDLDSKVASLYKIGTYARPGKVVDAIFDGFQTGFAV